MTREEIETHLNAVRSWAHEKLEAGQEPPWAYDHYTQLRDMMDATLEGLAATITLDEAIEQQDQTDPDNVVGLHPPKIILPL